ncbi:MAG: LysR family transcriptional regulator [Pseudomonadota bacterium]
MAFDHKRLDLNLLVVLQDLLRTSSVSQTAQNLGRTQPAISLALNRLRAQFDDPILIRNGPRLTKSPLAEQLETALGNQLAGLEQLYALADPFDPKDSTRQVVLAGQDFVASQLWSLSQYLRARAPNLTFRMARHTPRVDDILLGRVDLGLVLYPKPAPSAIKQIKLGDLPWATIVPQDHPISDTPSLEEWLSYQQVTVAISGDRPNPVDLALGVRAADRKIGLQVEGFLQAMQMVGEGGFLFTTIDRLVAPLVHRMGYRRVKLPFAIDPVPTVLWCRSTRTDAFSRWVLDHTRDAAKILNLS